MGFLVARGYLNTVPSGTRDAPLGPLELDAAPFVFARRRSDADLEFGAQTNWRTKLIPSGPAPAQFFFRRAPAAADDVRDDPQPWRGRFVHPGPVPAWFATRRFFQNQDEIDTPTPWRARLHHQGPAAGWLPFRLPDRVEPPSEERGKFFARIMPSGIAVAASWFPAPRRESSECDGDSVAVQKGRFPHALILPQWFPFQRRASLDAEFESFGVRRARWNPQLFARILSLAQELGAMASAGYRLFALNLQSGVETELGFVPAPGALHLDGAALADGDYELRVRCDGHFWKDARVVSAFPMKIDSGANTFPLPAVEDLNCAIEDANIYLSWQWEMSDGLQTPLDFALWMGASEPVDISGAPIDSVAAGAPGAMTIQLMGITEPVFAVVCARRGAARGPASTILISIPDIAPESPENQAARERLDQEHS